MPRRPAEAKRCRDRFRFEDRQARLLGIAQASQARASANSDDCAGGWRGHRPRDRAHQSGENFSLCPGSVQTAEAQVLHRFGPDTFPAVACESGSAARAEGRSRAPRSTRRDGSDDRRAAAIVATVPHAASNAELAARANGIALPTRAAISTDKNKMRPFLSTCRASFVAAALTMF